MSLFDTRPADRRFLGWAILFVLIGAALNSLWCIYIDDVVNNDAVEYIRAAERFAARDWSGAFTVHQWPFFSALMWVVGRLLGISYETAGYLLNSVFFTAASVFLFWWCMRSGARPEDSSRLPRCLPFCTPRSMNTGHSLSEMPDI